MQYSADKIGTCVVQRGYAEMNTHLSPTFLPKSPTFTNPTVFWAHTAAGSFAIALAPRVPDPVL